ncbi:hypothetical protein HDU92_002811 [Lobulomyces angularis]|nr:hypothetical protein HDU92_002811 [Lobulomyces angularis]
MDHCFVLDKANYCGPAFENVLISKNDAFFDQASFEHYLTLEINNYGSSIIQFNCSDSQKTLELWEKRAFQASFECSKYAYQSFYTCSTQAFSNTTIPSSFETVVPESLKLCNSQCQLSKYSFIDNFLSNDEVCPVLSEINSDRNSLIMQFEEFCNIFTGVNNGCYPGSPSESSNCGFISPSAALIGCRSHINSQDPCCISLVSKFPVTSAENSKFKPSTTSFISKTKMFNPPITETLEVSINSIENTLVETLIEADQEGGTLEKVNRASAKEELPHNNMLPGVIATFVILAMTIVVTCFIFRKKNLKKKKTLSLNMDRLKSELTEKRLNYRENFPSPSLKVEYIKAIKNVSKIPLKTYSMNGDIDLTEKINFKKIKSDEDSFFKNTEDHCILNSKNTRIQILKHNVSKNNTSEQKALFSETQTPNKYERINVSMRTSSSSIGNLLLSPKTKNFILDSKAKKMIVLVEYKSSQSDEVDLRFGEEIYVVEKFEDGWGLGIKVTDGLSGAFPLCCVCDSYKFKKEQELLIHETLRQNSSSNISGRTEIECVENIPIKKGLKRVTESQLYDEYFL